MLFRAGDIHWDRLTEKLKQLAQSPRDAKDSEMQPRN